MKPRCLFIVACGVAMLVSCGGKDAGSKNIVIVGTDTLTYARVTELTGGNGDDSAMAVRAVRQTILADRIDDTLTLSQVDGLSNELSDRIALRADSKLSESASRSLLVSTMALKAILDTAKNVDSITALLAQVLPGVFASDSGENSRVAKMKKEFTKSGADRERLADLVCCVLGVDSNQAAIAADFAVSLKKTVDDTSAVRSMIKNLVYDKEAAARRADSHVRIEAAKREVPDNSEMVLKFRNQQSIQDSISRHKVTIKALYKKHLKRDPDLAGVVTIRFRVEPGGNVIEAAVASSQIHDTALVTALLTYVRTIHFKKVPARVGNMTFQFPFEFSPEN